MQLQLICYHQSGSLHTKSVQKETVTLLDIDITVSSGIQHNVARRGGVRGRDGASNVRLRRQRSTRAPPWHIPCVWEATRCHHLPRELVTPLVWPN